MKSKKKVSIIVGIVLALIVVVLAAVVVSLSLDHSAKKTDNGISSGYFEVSVPTNTVITGDNKKGNIYATIPEEYGELRLSMTRSTSNVTQIVQKGSVTTDQVVVDGTTATQKTVDYAAVVRGASEKLLIRYEVSLDKIEKPSAAQYSTVTLTAMSRRTLTTTEKTEIQNKAKDIISSIVIK